MNFGIYEWNLIFSFNQIKASVIDVTPKLNTDIGLSKREDEIKSIHEEKYKNRPFIVIDDDIFDLHTMEDKLIYVNTKTGLTKKYFDEMLYKIGNQ